VALQQPLQHCLLLQRESCQLAEKHLNGSSSGSSSVGYRVVERLRRVWRNGGEIIKEEEKRIKCIEGYS
jgi:hypothetical protein